MDYKNIIIIVLVVALVAVLFYFLNKNKDKSEKKDTTNTTTTTEMYQYMNANAVKNQSMKGNKIDYDFKSDGTYVSLNEKEIEKQVIKESDNGINITNSNLAKNIQALNYKMDSQVNIDQYKDFIENQYSSEDKYNTIYAPEDTFQTIVQNDPNIPSEEKVKSDFKECMKSGNNTVEICLTASSSGLYPGLTKSLCQEYYDPLSPICNQIAIRQMKQMNNSARSGPA